LICVQIFQDAAWDLLWSKEKIKAILMQTFGGTNKEYYGVFESGLLRESLTAGVYFSQTSVTFAGDLAAVRIK